MSHSGGIGRMVDRKPNIMFVQDANVRRSRQREMVPADGTAVHTSGSHQWFTPVDVT